MVKNVFIRALVFAGLLFMLVLACHENQGVTLAVVDQWRVTEADFKPRLEQILYDAGVKDNMRLRTEVLREMINEHLMAEFAANMDVMSDTSYKAASAYASKKIILEAWRKYEIEDSVDISEEEMQIAFTQSNTRLKASHLFSRTLNEANELYDQLQSGQTFESLAPEVFNDPTLAQSGGSIGYFSLSEMDPAFELAAYSLEMGEVSQPIQTADGYSIIRIDDRVMRPLNTETEYATKRKHLRRYLRWREITMAKRQIVNDLLADANIHIDPEGLNTVLRLIQGNWTDSADSLQLFAGETLIGEVADQNCISFADTLWSIKDVLFQLMQVKTSRIQLVQDAYSLELVLQALIGRELLYQHARGREYHRLPDVENKLALVEKTTRARYIEQFIYDTLTVSNDEIRQYFEQHRSQFNHPEAVRVQVILHHDSTFLAGLKSRYFAGESFTSLVLSHSLDPGKELDKGIMNWSPRGRFGSYGESLFSIKPGELLGPVYDQDRFALVLLLEKREAKPMLVSEARDSIESTLLVEKQSEAYRKTISMLRHAASVDVDFEALRHVSIRSGN